MARLRLIAGPNGAGKSTFTSEILSKHVDLASVERRVHKRSVMHQTKQIIGMI